MQLSNWKLPISDWKWWYMLIALFAMMLTPLVPTWLAQSVAEHSSDMSFADVLKHYGHGFEFVKFALFTLVPIVLISVLKWQWASRADFPLWPLNKGNSKRVLISIVTGYAFYLISTIIFERTVSGATEASEQVSLSLGIGQSVTKDILVMLMVAVAAPIGEEFFFRGLIFRSVRDGLSNLHPWFRKQSWLTLLIAILISAYAFMSSHGGDGQDLQLYMIGLMGVIGALVYAWSGSLIAAVMIHAINNAVALYTIGHFINTTVALFVLAVCPIITLIIMHLINQLLAQAPDRTYSHTRVLK